MDTEFAAKKETGLRHKILYKYTNDLPVLPLCYRFDLAVIPKNLSGYVWTGQLYSETNNIEKWILK